MIMLLIIILGPFFGHVQHEIKESVISCQKVARRSQGISEVMRVMEVKSIKGPMDNMKTSEEIFDNDDYEWDTLLKDKEYEVFYFN